MAGFVVKLIGALNRIPLYAILGSEGIGLFQMAYPVYAILLTTSSAGVNVAISKVVAERWAVGRYEDAAKVFRVALILMLFVGAVTSGLLYLSSGWVAENIAKDPRAYLSIAAISPALLMASVLTVLRGWFQGLEQMTEPAISQVIEQIGRLVTMIVLARALLPRGIEYASAGATFGAVVGAFAGTIYLTVSYIKRRGEWVDTGHRAGAGTESWIRAAREIVVVAVPVSVASCIFGLTEILDLALVPRRLLASGFSLQEATTLYGRFTGGALPLINLATVFTGALQVALVPSISASMALVDRVGARRRIVKALHLTYGITLPAALGLFVLSDAVPAILFNDYLIGPILKTVVPAMLFLAIQQVTSGVLQGLGKMNIPLMNLVWAVLVKAALTYYLVPVKTLGIFGAGLATSIYFGVAALLNTLAIRREIGVIGQTQVALKFTFCGAVMALLVRLAYLKASLVLSWRIAVFLAIGVGIASYFLLAIITGALDLEDLRLLPLPDRVLKFLSRKR